MAQVVSAKVLGVTLRTVWLAVGLWYGLLPAYLRIARKHLGFEARAVTHGAFSKLRKGAVTYPTAIPLPGHEQISNLLTH